MTSLGVARISIDPSACSAIRLLRLIHRVQEHPAGGAEVPHVDEPGPAHPHAAHPRLVHVAEVQVVRLVLLHVVEQGPAARLRPARHHVEAQVVDCRRHVRAEHVDRWQAGHLGGELRVGDLGHVRPRAARQAAAHKADPQPADLHRLPVQVPDPRAQQVAELLREVGVAVGQVRLLGEGGEHRLVLGAAGRPHELASLRLAAGDAVAQHLARLVEPARGAQLRKAPRRLRPVDVRHDPLQRAVVDEVEQVAADEQHVGAGGLGAEPLRGAVDVGNDLDADGGSLRRLGCGCGGGRARRCGTARRDASPCYGTTSTAGRRYARTGNRGARREGGVPLPAGPVVGTCGFGYQEWRGRFYPPELAPSEWLGFYAQVFEAVELDGTFYRPPEPAVAASWAAAPPAQGCWTRSKRCGSNSSTGRSVRPVSASCAAASPITGANLNPCPEKPASTVRPGRSRRRPTTKCRSGVSAYVHGFIRTGRGRSPGRLAATMLPVRAASASSGGRGPTTGSTGSSVPGQSCVATLTVAPSRLGQPYQERSPLGSLRMKTGNRAVENASGEVAANQPGTRRTTWRGRSSPGARRGSQAPAATTTCPATTSRPGSRTTGRSGSGTIWWTRSPVTRRAPAARAARTAATTARSGRTTPASSS